MMSNKIHNIQVHTYSRLATEAWRMAVVVVLYKYRIYLIDDVYIIFRYIVLVTEAWRMAVVEANYYFCIM